MCETVKDCPYNYKADIWSFGQLTLFIIVMCEYSKFRIESNSYLLFDSIRNWRNYSKFSNTYLTVISRAIDMRFVCTLPATSRCTHLSVEPSAVPRVFLLLPLPWVPWSRTHARCPVCACVLPVPGLDRGIWLRYNGVRQAQRMVSWALALLSVFLWIQLTRRRAAFKVHGDTGPANVILSLWLAHAARCLVSTAHVRKTTSAQLQPRIAIDLLTGKPSSATWVVHYTLRMQEIMHKIYFTLF